MKILYHHRTASRDGQSTHIEEMIRGLRSVGCTVEESAPAVSAQASTGGSPGWVGAMKRWLPRPFYEIAEVAYSWVAYRRLSTHIVQFRPDAIYERYNLYLLAGVWAKRRFGIPLILEVNAPMAIERRQYGGLSLPWLADWAERYVWRNADAVLPVTDVLARHLVQCGVDPRRIRVIPNGINEEEYRDLPSTDEAKKRLHLAGRLVIGFIGFVREWDQLDRIVRWIADNRRQVLSAHLLVIGDGPARADIERCAKDLGVSDRLSFTGVVARCDVPALANAFDIALQTALVPYASPLCLFEYLALAKAIVAPDQPNHHEILVHGESAWLYDPVSARGVEQALDALCADDQLRQRISVGAARVIADKRLTWQQHATSVVDVFSRIGKEPAAGVRDVVSASKV
jgi:glycosyltransferase involved in cell wall biosynthesis